MRRIVALAITATAMVLALGAPLPGQGIHGWLSWRGPQQNGTSLERGLPEELSRSEGSGSWTFEMSGRGTPVIASGRVYAMAYEGEGGALQEVLLCLDEKTGEKIWDRRFTVFLTDTIYYRFAIGSPTIDPETGNVYCLTTSGLVCGFTRDGEPLWQHAMLAEQGRRSFPNGRTGSPVVDDDLVIAHMPTSSWGPMAPTRDRFYAFDKTSGELVWTSTPGGPPKDASFSMPVVAWENGKRVLYAGLAGGHLVCVNARTGAPIWRYQMSVGGLSSSPVLYKNSIIAVHGKENLDDSTIGRMVAIRLGAGGDSPLVLDRSQELWRNPLVSFTSSPVLAGNRIYQTVSHGDLYCVDADSGEALWHHKLAPDQIHASPVFGDGKLYVPMNNGSFYVIRPSDEGPEILQKLQLEGNCLGAPAIAFGRIYVHTTKRLYCFGGGTAATPPHLAPSQGPPLGEATALQVVPCDFVVQQGETAPLRARTLDPAGQLVADKLDDAQWSGLPAGVTVADGTLTVAADAPPAATVITASAGEMSATARLRIVPKVPFTIDFEDATATPPYWVLAGRTWEVLERDGSQVLARTLKNPLFQRTFSLIGDADMANNTVQADILVDRTRRIMASGGVINQRYLIVLKGNYQQLEVSSNMELFRTTVPFTVKAGTWYTLKTRVDVFDDGSGVVRAKAWPRDDPEPEDWTIEVPHVHVHTHGSPGVYGFTPQNRVRSYVDNISVTANG